MMIFGYGKEQLEKLGAAYTAEEINQQPEIWKQVYAEIMGLRNEIGTFLEKNLLADTRVVLTGAGTSAYTGDIARCHLNGLLPCRVESIPTTDIVANPAQVLEPHTPTILVSFARSGNSPESVGAYRVMEEHTNSIVHLVITCAAEGSLAQAAGKDSKNFVLLLPKETNDRGFAMTSSFSCMLLAALLFFDISSIKRNGEYVTTMADVGRKILDTRWEWVRQLADLHPERIVYLGTGCMSELGKELSLKNMELTNGKIVSTKESVLGFRHGPKTIVNDRTLLMLMSSSSSYTNQYVRDIARELLGDPGEHCLAILDCAGDMELKEQASYYSALEAAGLPEAYTALLYALYGQMLALFNSIAVGNTPDSPNPLGVVNRVVKGVTIYEYR